MILSYKGYTSMAATTHHVQCTTCIVPFHALQRPPQPAAKRFTVSLHDSPPWHGALYALQHATPQPLSVSMTATIAGMALCPFTPYNMPPSKPTR